MKSFVKEIEIFYRKNFIENLEVVLDILVNWHISKGILRIDMSLMNPILDKKNKKIHIDMKRVFIKKKLFKKSKDLGFFNMWAPARHPPPSNAALLLSQGGYWVKEVYAAEISVSKYRRKCVNFRRYRWLVWTNLSMPFQVKICHILSLIITLIVISNNQLPD